MTPLKAFLVAVLEMSGAQRGTALYRRVVDLAPIVYEQAREAIDPLVVAAVIVRESMWNPDAVGRHGEIGLMQIKPDAVGIMLCPDLLATLFDPVSNVRCGIRALRAARRKCLELTAMLSAYNGQRCGPSGYASRVLALLPSRRKLALATP